MIAGGGTLEEEDCGGSLEEEDCSDCCRKRIVVISQIGGSW